MCVAFVWKEPPLGMRIAVKTKTRNDTNIDCSAEADFNVFDRAASKK